MKTKVLKQPTHLMMVNLVEIFQLLSSLLADLERQKKKRTHTNLLASFSDNNIDNTMADDILNAAMEANFIYSYRYAQQINYKLHTPQSATITDQVADVSTETSSGDQTSMEASTGIQTQTEESALENEPPPDDQYVKQGDLERFRKEILDNISCCFQQLNSSSPVPSINSQSSNDAVVATLLKHIEFLQAPITSLIAKPSTPIPSPPNPAPPQQVTHSRLTPEQTRQQNATLQATRSRLASSTPVNRDETSPQAPASETGSATAPQRKKQVLIVGDSMLNCLDEKKLRRNAFVRIRSNPGATVEDLQDHLRPLTRHVKHDAVLIMAGTNDISFNNFEGNKDKPKRDTETHMRDLIKQIKETNGPDTHIAICQVTARKDKPGIMRQVNELNEKLRLVAQREQVEFVNTSHFRQDHTGQKGIHPNRQGADVLHKTLDKYVYRVSRL